jgi:pimeloyl-CoA synthetase
MEDSRANGDISYRERWIRVRVDMAPSQQAKTMSRELGHVLLEDEAITDRPLAELMAESIASMVCAACGIDSSDYRFGYVATWSCGGDEAIAAIKAVGTRIQRVANELLGLLEPAGVVALTAA